MLRISTLLLASLLLSGAAFAKKGGGDDEGKIRVKLSTGLYSALKSEATYDGEDAGVTKMKSITLGHGGSRWQGGYLLGQGLEVGAIVGYSSTSGSFEPPEGDSVDFDPTKTMELAPYVAYNKNVGDGLTGYGELHVGIRNTTTEGENADTVTKEKPIGLGAGVRIKVMKKASFDVGAEYEMSKPVTEVDGESDDKLETKNSNIGLRTGLSIRF